MDGNKENNKDDINILRVPFFTSNENQNFTNNTSIRTFNITIPYIHQPFLIGTICWILGLCGGWLWEVMHYIYCLLWPVIYYLGILTGFILCVIILGLLILIPLGTMTKPDDGSINRFINKIKQLHKQNEEFGLRNNLINPITCSIVSNSDIEPIPIDWGFFKIANVMRKNQFDRRTVYIIGAFRGWYLLDR